MTYKKIIVFAIAVLLVSSAIFACNGKPDNYKSVITATPSLQDLVLSPTPLPEEFITNREQTRGIVIGGVILVLIVVIGTFSFIRQKP